MGADIAGACGQLVVEEEKKKQGHVVDIEDGPFGTNDGSKGAASKLVTRKNHGERSDDIIGSKDGGGDPWVRRLTIATAVAASCFAVSGALLLLQRKKR